MYNGPSVVFRVSICALVALFLYSLKLLIIFYSPKWKKFQVIVIIPILFGSACMQRKLYGKATKFHGNCANT